MEREDVSMLALTADVVIVVDVLSFTTRAQSSLNLQGDFRLKHF